MEPESPTNGCFDDWLYAPATPEDRRTERNMAKGRHAYVRLDVTNCLDGLHVKVSVQNPHNVVGGAAVFARDYAVMCAQILAYLQRAVTTTSIVLIEGDGADGVLYLTKPPRSSAVATCGASAPSAPTASTGTARRASPNAHFTPTANARRYDDET